MATIAESPTRVTNVTAGRVTRRSSAQQSPLRRYGPALLATVFTVALLGLSVFTGVADITDTAGGGSDFLWITRIPRTVALVLS